MGSIRQIKKNQKPKFNHQINLPLAEDLIFNRGFTAGAKEQRESDINCLIDLLEGLEEWHGIGEVTAKKIRKHFLSKFGIEEDV